MVSVVCIAKDSSIKQSVHRSCSSDDLFRRAGLRSDNAFSKRAEWTYSEMKIELWAKDKGRAGGENKYDFPPPVDTTLFFGTCVLVARNACGALIDLSASTWDKAYDAMMGGFTDLTQMDEEDRSDCDEFDNLPTQNGYALDDFVVDDELELEEYV